MPKLRDYQIDIIGQVERLDHPLIPLPTGGGKTVIAAAMIEKAVKAQQQRVVFMVHRRELVTQASAKLRTVGVDHAILMGAESTEYLGQRCIIASTQTLYARAFRTRKIDRPPADIIIFDEAHHCRAPTYLELRKAYPDAKIIGLTATPARGDGRGLGGDLFSDLVEVPSYAWLIENKYLVRPVVFAPVRPDLKGVKTLDTGDYSPSQLEERMNTNALVGGIVEHWFKLGENRPTIVFTAGVKHSAHLQREFEVASVAAAHLDARTPLEERKRIIAGFRSGDIRVLWNCMILTEGFDEPSVSDHSGAVYRHSFADDEIEWALSPDETAVNQSAVARANGHRRELANCPSCAAVRLEGEVCRVCGWAPETKPQHLEVADGELGEVQRDCGPPRPIEWSTAEELAFYLQLMWIARQRQYRDGWAAHKFRERCGKFPPWNWNRAEPSPPCGAVRAWVRSRAIAFTKSMAASG